MNHRHRGDVADVVCALLVSDGEILLGLRASHRRSYANHWDLIGGHVKVGETLIDALKRELMEEVGISEAQPRAFDSLGYDNASGGLSRLHIFFVDRWKGTPTLANDEHTELRWFHPQEAALLTLALPAYKALFARL
jgi:8-oxo-dGTP diphosphatase